MRVRHSSAYRARMCKKRKQARAIMQQELKKKKGGPLDPSADKKSGQAERKQLAAVMEIAHAINSQPDLEHILSTISSELSKVIDFDIGCVAI